LPQLRFNAFCLGRPFHNFQKYRIKCALSTTSPKFKAVRRGVITTKAPDKHPVDGIPESADGSSSTLISIQKSMNVLKSEKNCDFEPKNGSGFWGRGLIAGARFEHTTFWCGGDWRKNC